MDLSAWSLGACLKTLALFFLIISPLYLMLRFFVGLIRAYYGFDEAGTDEAQGPPLRICSACHNTVMEADFQHCPYCGRPLPQADPEPGPEAGAGAVSGPIAPPGGPGL